MKKENKRKREEKRKMTSDRNIEGNSISRSVNVSTVKLNKLCHAMKFSESYQIDSVRGTVILLFFCTSCTPPLDSTCHLLNVLSWH